MPIAKALAPVADDALGLIQRSQPFRASLTDEMHIRKLPRFTTPMRMMQIVTQIGECDPGPLRQQIEALSAQHKVEISESEKYVVVRLDDIVLVWEHHTEVASYSLIRTGFSKFGFNSDCFQPVLSELLSQMPGQIIRATQIALVASDTSDETLSMLQAWFAVDDLIVCDVADGSARIWSDFRLHGDAFGRLLVLDRGLEGYEAVQVVQRLQELGNYRNLALLGLPVAQRLTPQVSELERKLAKLTAAIAEHVSSDDNLLAELGSISAELARLMAETRYRMSATRAYADLSLDRLNSLKINAVRGFPTLADFTERRLIPAVRTCASFSRRLEDLSQQAAWTSALLRTRVDTALAIQNCRLLESMDRRNTLQFRLQQTVEGLSVVAISYYSISLLGYVFKALHESMGGPRPEIATGLAVPLIAALVTLSARRMRRRLHQN